MCKDCSQGYYLQIADRSQGRIGTCAEKDPIEDVLPSFDLFISNLDADYGAEVST